MRILHVYKTYYPEDFTGVPRVIHALARGMSERNIESNVLALGKSESSFRYDGHGVHIAKRHIDLASTGMSMSAFSIFRKLASQADIIHYHFPWPFADLLHLFVRPKAPRVVTYHSDIVRQRRLLAMYAPLQNRFLDDASRIVATSPNYLASSEVLQRYKAKVEVIPIGLPDANATASKVSEWRAKVGEDFFLFVGALRYYKGLSYLLEAARSSGIRTVIVGDGDAAKLPDLPPWVTLVGAVADDDKLALLELCRALVLPSHLRSEAFGISLLEAARAGKPMISCEIGTGTTYINISEVTGLVVPPSSAGALAGAMQNLLQNSSLASKMGKAARERYEATFTDELMVTKTLALYQELCLR